MFKGYFINRSELCVIALTYSYHSQLHRILCSRFDWVLTLFWYKI